MASDPEPQLEMGSLSDASTEEAIIVAGRRPNRRPEGRWVILSMEEGTGQPLEPNEALTKWRSICGIVGRNVRITLSKWSKLTKEERAFIVQDVKRSFEVPEGRDKDFARATLLTAGKAWREFKTTLRKDFIQKKRDPFNKYPQITREQWRDFTDEFFSPEFQNKSKKGKELASKNIHPHMLGTSGYVKARKKWEKEDEEAIKYGVEPAFSEFSGDSRIRDWNRARSYINNQGVRVWKNPADEQIYNKMVDLTQQMSQGTFRPTRENDILTESLGTREPYGRCRAVGNLATWSKFFPHDKVEARRERKREKEERRKREIEEVVQSRYEDRISRLEAQLSRCSQGGVTDASPGTRRSSCASGTVLDTPIDHLEEVAPCKLQVFIETLHFNMEVGRGLVHPPHTAKSLHGVPIPPAYAKVQVNEVLPAFAGTPLPNVGADAEHQFLGQSVHSFIMWPKKDIMLELPASTPSPSTQRTPVHQPEASPRRTPPPYS